MTWRPAKVTHLPYLYLHLAPLMIYEPMRPIVAHLSELEASVASCTPPWMLPCLQCTAQSMWQDEPLAVYYAITRPLHISIPVRGQWPKQEPKSLQLIMLQMPWQKWYGCQRFKEQSVTVEMKMFINICSKQSFIKQNSHDDFDQTADSFMFWEIHWLDISTIYLTLLQRLKGHLDSGEYGCTKVITVIHIRFPDKSCMLNLEVKVDDGVEKLWLYL